MFESSHCSLTPARTLSDKQGSFLTGDFVKALEDGSHGAKDEDCKKKQTNKQQKNKANRDGLTQCS